MKKDRVWIRDAINKGEVNFYIGQKVVLYRRKASGYPKFLDENKTYIIKFLGSEDVTIQEETHPKMLLAGFIMWKLNRTFFIPKDKCRDILISEILKDLD